MTSDARDHMTTDDPLHFEAASWFMRIHTREPGMEEVADWQRWLMADEAHRHAFSRAEDLWQAIGLTELHFRRQNGQNAWSALAARSRAVQRHWPHALAATALVAMIGAGFLFSGSRQSPQLPASAAVETRTAEDRTYFLADGSRVEVGARTRVVVDFSGPTRSVFIDSGEAYFQVAHDTTRPFVVHAGGGTITAVGTAFNVHNALGRVSVAVVEGAVDVQNSAQDEPSMPHQDNTVRSHSLPPVLVHAGEGVAYDRVTRSVESVDTRVATSWRDGHLKFLREPLAYVVSDIGRYADLQISIADPSLGELLYTGTVVPKELDDWLALLAHAFPIEVQRIDKRTILLKRRTLPAAVIVSMQ